jgi:hypothetical protein
MPYRNFHFSSHAPSEAGKPQSANVRKLVRSTCTCSMKMSTKGMRLLSFTVSEKLRIVREAEEIGNRTAG